MARVRGAARARAVIAAAGAWARRWVRDDPARAAIRIGFVLLALAAIAWDLPSSFSWENDGVAPRDIFAGVAENLRPGAAFRYPLLHPLLLGLLCLPVLLPAALRARSFAFADLQAAVLAPPVMTACALIGRLVAMVAAVIALAALGRIATRLAGRRVAPWAEAFAALNLSFSYYGRATNLDGPALMWSVLAVERLVRVADASPGDARKDLVAGAVFAALSMATKDQAYAGYVILVPCMIGCLARTGLAARARDLLHAVAWMLATYAAASGAVFNPTGFVTRVHALVGGASADYQAYARGAAGVLANLADIGRAQGDLWWPWSIVALAWAGVAIVVVAERGRRRIVRLMPLAAGLGGLCAFALVVGRAEHRFVLPLGFWLSIYVAIAVERARARLHAAWPGQGGRWAASLIAGGALAWAAVPAVGLIATQWGDGRRAVERWLARQPPGTTVETFGPLVYLPRFTPSPPAPYQVTHVGREPLAGRNPQPGVAERHGSFAGIAARRPDVLVLSEGFVAPFIEAPPAGARVLPEVTRRARADAATASLVAAAVRDELPGYRVCFVAEARLPGWLAPRRIHGSTGARTWVLVRESPR